MKLKVVSDGTAERTKITNAETGELLENVAAVFWSVSASGKDRLAQVGITLLMTPVELEGDAELKYFSPLEQPCPAN